jgi:hypothetical protein
LRSERSERLETTQSGFEHEVVEPAHRVAEEVIHILEHPVETVSGPT